MKARGDSAGEPNLGDRPLFDVLGIKDTEPRTPILGVMREVHNVPVVFFTF